MRYMGHSMRMLLHSALQYRASFIMQCLGQIVMLGGELMAVLVLMNKFAGLGQWTPAEILFFWSMMNITFSLTECIARGITSFAGYVGSGEFDTFLLRPKPLLLQVIAARLDPRRFGAMLVGGVAFVVANATLTIQWTVGKVLLLLCSMLGSFLLLTGLFLVEATFSFFSVRSIEMVNVLTYGGRQTCQYPVNIYPKPLRTLFTWVAPFALCMHLPVSFVLDKPMMALPLWVGFLSPLSGAVFFLLMVRVWYWGAAHYRSTGS